MFEPNGSAVKLCAIHCSICGAVVEVTDYVSLGSDTTAIMDQLAKLTKMVERLAWKLQV